MTAIPNGIDPTDLQPVEDLPRLRAQFAAPDEKLVLLVGRLVYEKGFHLALDAMPRLIERLGGVRFLVAGSGTAEAELKAQAERLDLMEHGSFVGWTGDDVLHSLYRIADLCLVPSLYEPFGLVALEAMASGCPCIVADTGGLREVVPGGRRVGLRFRARDPRSLARDGRAAAERRRAARPAGGRGGRVGAALRLGRRRAPDRGGLRRPARRARLVGRDDVTGRDRRAGEHRGVDPDPRPVADRRTRRCTAFRERSDRRRQITAQSPTVAPAPTSMPASRHEHRPLADPRARPDPHGSAVRLDPAALTEPAAILQHHARATRHRRSRTPRPTCTRPWTLDPAVELRQGRSQAAYVRSTSSADQRTGTRSCAPGATVSSSPWRAAITFASLDPERAVALEHQRRRGGTRRSTSSTAGGSG